MFGGSKNTFGQPSTPAFSSFNSPQQNTGFGQSAFAKPGGAFGTFGQQQTSVFGATPQPGGSSLFGATSTPQQQGFGTFGQPQQQQTSIFGNTSTTGTTSLFGSQATPAFGAAKPPGFGFGQPQQPSTSLFSTNPAQPQQTSLFGQTGTTNTAGGLFGSAGATSFGQPAGNQQSGTAVAKFQAPQETDTLMKGSQASYVQTKQQCITFMKEYAEKSLEELRIEDYAANRKGPQAGAGLFGNTQTGGVFGSTLQQQQPTSLFGTQQNTQQTPGLFGSTGAAITGGSTFGQPSSTFGQQNAGGLFGKPLTTPATTSAFTAFGANTSTFGAAKPFGQATATPGTGLFGQSQTPAFGSTTTNTFGAAAPAFGQTQPTQGTSLFGANPTSQTAPAFGLGATSTPSTGFGFGQSNTNTTTGLFGSQKPTFNTGTSAFGAAQPSTSTTGFTGFGQTTGSSLFNQQNPATGFGGFGQPQATAAPTVSFGQNTGGSLFGPTNQTTGGLFGGSSTAATGGLFGGTSTGGFGVATSGMSFGQQQPNLFGGQQQIQQQQIGQEIHQKILALASNPYGENELFKGLKPVIGLSEDSLKPTNPAAQKALLEASNNYRISPNAGAKLKVKPISGVVTKKSLFDGLEEYDQSLDESFTLKVNPKRLIIKPRESPNNISRITTVDDSSTTFIKVRDDPKAIQEKENDAPESFRNQIPFSQPADDDQDTDRRVSWLRTAPSQGIRPRPKLRETFGDTTFTQMHSIRNSSKGKEDQENSQIIEQSSPNSISMLNETFRSNEDAQSEADISIITGPSDPHPTGIILRRAGYYTIPSLDELVEYLDTEGRCVVSDFTIGRRGYGNVYFDHEMDVSGLNLDEICHFRNKEIILYQDDDNKPPIGEGLNRKAQVTLDQIWPHDKNTHEPIKDPERLEALGYEAKLRRICDKRGTRFIEYRPETGSCVFKVEHFSKYTLSDSDEDDGGESEPRVDPKKAKLIPPQQLPPGAAASLKNGKKPEVGKENLTGSEGMSRIRQQEASFFLGQHVGQRSFQQYFQPEDEMVDLTHEGPTSPSAALAKEMRADPHKLQLMKASFFVEDDYDTRSVMSDMTEGRESPDQMVPTVFGHKPSSFANRLLMSSARIIEDDAMIGEKVHEKSSTESSLTTRKHQDLVPLQVPKPIGPKSAPLIVRPRVMLFDIVDMMLPMNDSILNEIKERKSNTIPFFHGRKFKISWSCGNKFTVLGTQRQQQQHRQDSLFDGRSYGDTSKSIVTIRQIKSTGEDFHKSIVGHLKIRLKHDKRMEVDDSDCPRLEAGGGTDALLEHHKYAQKIARDNQECQFNATVWSLMHALWGFIDDMDPWEHAVVMLRRDLLSSWIESVVTDNDLLKSNVDYLDRLMNYMMCHKVNEACDLALSNSDINLSILMAQSSGGPAIRQLIQHQLESWRENKSNEFIDERRLRIMMMIGGVSAMEGPKMSPINIFSQIDWLKSLALQLWYISSPISSVTDALYAYEQNFQHLEYEVAPPTPSYVNQLMNSSHDFKYYDIRFHLMKLFSQRSHPLETLLHPANYTMDLMDFRLSFLLLQVLDTLGYHHLSDSCRLKIYSSLAEQLETNGMWEWSIWIMLHVNDKNHRENAIQQLLYRHIRIDGESNEDKNYSEKEEFVVKTLQVPEKWVSYSKAVRAGAMGNHHVELKYLLKAKQSSRAHEVMMRHIAPDLVINDQMDYLKSLLKQFEDCHDIQNWKTQGEVLLHFIELNEKFKTLNENMEDVDEDLFLEQISSKLSDLCSIIRFFPCPTSKHRLCQCDISKQLAYIIRNFYANSSAYGSQACALMRTALERLPLPQEFAQQELKHVLRTFMMEKLTIN
ncbi:CLUMA_CG003627, isoform A [Clunio marinus]|uniref:Nuclear pore complex protein Nup98-Nup96 n=1 Tax=Clunio marinus TaxID=568069 RepID=A0A1J1HPC3_9DIPT|nr:CLUMA_CG003627, isoform A [Clunio marinus]